MQITWQEAKVRWAHPIIWPSSRPPPPTTSLLLHQLPMMKYHWNFPRGWQDICPKGENLHKLWELIFDDNWWWRRKRKWNVRLRIAASRSKYNFIGRLATSWRADRDSQQTVGKTPELRIWTSSCGIDIWRWCCQTASLRENNVFSVQSQSK